MVKEKWMVYGKKADFNGLALKYKISPVTARVIRNRNMTDDRAFDQYLNGTIDSINSPFLFKDMEKAVDILFEAIKNNERIRIIGDYDIDGICSTYILVKAISKFTGNISMDIPDRIKDGYGINKKLIKKAYDEKIKLIITCDNGIAAIDETAYAKELGMKVIVTDHHNVPFDIVDNQMVYKRVQADAVVNHKQPDCTYPFKEMCGAAIAYRFVMACMLKLKEKQDTRYKLIEAFEKEMIIFAGIATIGDVVSLLDENRIIAKAGLSLLKENTNIGLEALINCCELDKNNISSFHIGYIIGPCLNAAGRLETAKMGLELLLCDNKEKAEKLAEELVILNQKRKELTLEGEKKAVDYALKMEDSKVLVIFLEDIHESIAGIIAGRIREKFNKPTIILTKGEEMVKGSGRSIEGYNMYEEINKCSKLLSRFGGHIMAAGVSLEEKNVEAFREMLNKNCSLTEDDYIKKVWIDVPMPLNYISGELIHELKKLEPFGKDNEKPIFAVKDIVVKKMYLMGKAKNMARLILVENGYEIAGVMFNGLEDYLTGISDKYGEETVRKMQMGMTVNIAGAFTYYPTINNYNGNESIQITITGFSL